MLSLGLDAVLTAYSGSMKGSLTETMSMSWCSTLNTVRMFSYYSSRTVMNIRVAEDDATNAAETVDTDLCLVLDAGVVYPYTLLLCLP